MKKIAKPTNQAAALTCHQQGLVALLANHLEQAESLFRMALQAKPDFAEAHDNLGLLLVATGRRAEAIQHHVAAIRLEPKHPQNWFNFGAALNDLRLSKADAGFYADLRRAFSEPGCDHRHLVMAAYSLIEADLGEDGWLDTDRLAAHPLLTVLLESALVADPMAERRLTGLRRLLLDQALHGQEQRIPLGLAVALARQAYYSEYAWAVSSDEQIALGRLNRDSPKALAVGAAYRPLDPALPRSGWPEPLRRLGVLMIDEPAKELVLAAALPALTPVDDEVSKAVQAQYETHPYPRWIDLPRLGRRRSLADHLALLFPGQRLDVPPATTLQILIAGCGTGLQSILAAQRYAHSTVLAIDLSRASLAYAERQRQRMKVDNLSHAQADILHLRRLGRRFHLIESYGVLHHLEEPAQGLAVLADLLEPGGYLMLGLYSQTARQDVVATRDFIARHGFSDDDEGIRRARAAILQESRETPVGRMASSLDFYSLSLCRDLLFHVQEHRLTLPQIKVLLDKAQLDFIGFDLPQPAIAMAYRQRFPEDVEMTSLDNWAVFEAEHPTTFTSTYRFWTRKRPL